MTISLRKLLSENKIEASAPCRIDSGGTWDIKAMSLPFEGIEPLTVNVALSLRTKVNLSPYKNGWVRISSEGFPNGETSRYDNLSFTSSFGLFFAAISHFGFHGLHAHIISQSPIRSALGGSSTALVALIKALTKASDMIGLRKTSKNQILHLGYILEDGISGGSCGIQDQAAAVYGGVNKWHWQFSNQQTPFQRKSLLDKKGQKELSRSLLVAFSGKRHVSSRTNRKWINDFLSGKTRLGWIEANEIIKKLANAIQERNWVKAAGLLRKEMAVRMEITPEALIPVTSLLIEQAEKIGCGARFTGAGAGGAVWALGEIDSINKLRKMWKTTLSPIKGAKILDCEIDRAGVK